MTKKMGDVDDFISYLLNEYSRRSQKNPRYTLRAFALSLNEEPSFFIKILKRRKRLTSQKLYKYAKALNLDREILCDFLLSQLEERVPKEESN